MIIPGGVVDVGAKLNPNNPGGASTWTITVDAALSVAVAVSVSSSRGRRTLSLVLTTAEAEILVVVMVVDETVASIGFVFDDDALSILIDLFVILTYLFVMIVWSIGAVFFCVVLRVQKVPLCGR